MFFFDQLFRRCVKLGIIPAMLLASPALAQKEIYNTQKEDTKRQTAEETASGSKLPDGFTMEVVSSEPDVQQPIASAWDARGRLWIAENYTYSENPRNFDTDLRDRILVLEDGDGDGKFEKRKIFSDQLSKLTSVEVGFGGIWALCPPNLFFIPDQDGDDVPDSEPQVVLDGFDAERVRHNFANGLRWGPDGWLYGRHGIQATSYVGLPGQPSSARTELNCCVWRFQPQSKRFEIVCQGTTNPWGMDWDENGHLFFINTVIGHLWHAMPGAHFQRMYGQDLDPHVYQLLPQTADHVHWNVANEEWHRIQKSGISQETDQAGGGHAHSGLLIYQGDNWPENLRGSMLTLNFHGRRINRDSLERQGAGFVGRHQPDLVQFSDPWFRGIDLSTGPDGAVYLLDWSDSGECHENDGVHRTSGRVYRLRYGTDAKRASIDLSILSDKELVDLLSHRNNWYPRMARRLLTERALSGKLQTETTGLIATPALQAVPGKRQLEHLWTAHACGILKPADLVALLGNSNEHVRIWALRLLGDTSNLDDAAEEAILRLAKSEKSDLVKLYLAGMLDRFAGDRWWQIATVMATQHHLESDRDYPLMLWYAIKNRVAAYPGQAVELIRSNPIKPLPEFIARRLTTQIDAVPSGVDGLVEVLMASKSRSDILRGMTMAVRGRRKLNMPQVWNKLVEKLSDDEPADVRQAIATLGAVFGQGLATDQLKAIVTDGAMDTTARREAFQSLVDSKADGLNDLAWRYINDREMSVTAIRVLASVGEPGDADQLIAQMPNLSTPSKIAAIQTLSGRADFIPKLLTAVQSGQVAKDSVDASTLRQIQMSSGQEQQKQLAAIWPNSQLLNENKLARIRDLETMLGTKPSQPVNVANGRKLWNKHCASCHRLFGEGAAIGPEITGSQRSNLRYVLENVVDPSASVADNFRVTLYRLENGQIITGVPINRTSETVTIQTAKEQITISLSDIEESKSSMLSLMPDGLLDALSESEQRDLIGYLQSPVQVALEE